MATDPLSGLKGQKLANAKATLEAYQRIRKGPSGETLIELKFSTVPARWNATTQSRRGKQYGSKKMFRTDVAVTVTLSPAALILDGLFKEPRKVTPNLIPLGFEILTPPDEIENLYLVTAADLFHNFHLRPALLLMMKTGPCITFRRVLRPDIEKKLETLTALHRAEISAFVRKRLTQ